jgi:ubiquinone/menaquinone biosynthesis C-methylase UbiE
MDDLDHLPRLYRDLSDWWPVLSIPEEYAEEAECYRNALVSSASAPIHTVLELGSGGGNNASHLKKHFQMTLVDLSPGMLEVSRRLNPECEHLQGDMRSVRLGRPFDAVFIHDAIAYMASAEDLRRALRTAYVHCKPGGAALFTPDQTRETFKPYTNHGGYDVGSRSLRYLEWAWDPDPADTTYQFLMVYVLRQAGDEVQIIEDRHICGLFSHGEWLSMLAEVGFEGRSLLLELSEIEPYSGQAFIGVKPAEEE